jgi:cysteinyl-tRNA synthetase
MSWRWLGENFDIHGGGDDLIFPHHENEIAQSCCAFPGSGFANFWVHNRMLLVNGEKMSKSLGNFITVRDALSRANGEVIRFLLMRSHYRSTLDFTDAGLKEARAELDRFYRAIQKYPAATDRQVPVIPVFDALLDDLNTPAAITALHSYADLAFADDEAGAVALKASGKLLGLFNMTPDEWFRRGEDNTAINLLIKQRMIARRNKNFAEADDLRRKLKELGVTLEDRSDGRTEYRYDS